MPQLNPHQKALELAGRELCREGEVVSRAVFTGTCLIALIETDANWIVYAGRTDALLAKRKLMPGEPYPVQFASRQRALDYYEELRERFD